MRSDSETGFSADENDIGDSIEETAEGILTTLLRRIERRFFPGVRPVNGIEVVRNSHFPCRYVPAANKIQIHAEVSQFAKLSALLIVHELVHHKLQEADPNYAYNPYGPKFRDEIMELAKQDDYLRLL